MSLLGGHAATVLADVPPLSYEILVVFLPHPVVADVHQQTEVLVMSPVGHFDVRHHTLLLSLVVVGGLFMQPL